MCSFARKKGSMAGSVWKTSSPHEAICVLEILSAHLFQSEEGEGPRKNNENENENAPCHSQAPPPKPSNRPPPPSQY